jgi:3D (Asp-Asp-Asp) domain-containing protein
VMDVSIGRRIAIFLAAVGFPTAAGAGGPIRYPGRWQLTQYWIADERPAPEDRRPVNILDRNGDRVALSCPRFLQDLTMEGTGRTWDGRILNWDGRVNGRPCFIEVDRDSYPYGIGVQGYALVPFRSLAVDRRFIPIGHTVEMPDLAGMPLPDGSIHDGCFVAVDGGGAIIGHHIDLFVPSESDWRELNRGGFLPRHVQNVTVDAPRCEHARRYAWLPLPTDPALPR